ncbi:hypothetical protein PR048_006211 [Dryococelus australis]|uniref:Uncharacterized protein n=1 Tax=Dryococelus australis TaxID=614101 RepID=A0ABQ9IAE8_9NEOP|nr:hypothetical protein PR048_006211 [Dryococelus australis]
MHRRWERTRWLQDGGRERERERERERRQTLRGRAPRREKSEHKAKHVLVLWPVTAVIERLDSSPSIKAKRVQSRPSHSRTFASGNRAGRCRWSASFLGGLPFPLALVFLYCSIITSFNPHRLSRSRIQVPPESLNSTKRNTALTVQLFSPNLSFPHSPIYLLLKLGKHKTSTLPAGGEAPEAFSRPVWRLPHPPPGTDNFVLGTNLKTHSGRGREEQGSDCVNMKRRQNAKCGGWEIPEKTRRPVASPGKIPARKYRDVSL